MKELLLITAVDDRVENLPIIFESIKKNLLPLNDDLHVTWVISHDVNKSQDKIDYMREFLRQLSLVSNNSGISWSYSPVFLPKEGKNYGGALLNEPIDYAIDNYLKGIDPWIYILDIDNTICDLLPEHILNMIEIAEANNKDIIMTNMKYSCGTSSPYTKEHFEALMKIVDDIIPWHMVMDPSRIFIKYSYLKKMGMFLNHRDYDVYFSNKVTKDYHDNILFQDEFDKELGWKAGPWQTTHNAIPSKDRIKKMIEMADSNSPKDCMVTICDRKNGPLSLHIKPKVLKEIIDKNFDYDED